ncbi:MAG: hypothetical protein AB7I13_14525, partial [Vicinamibacterales bacterium]
MRTSSRTYVRAGILLTGLVAACTLPVSRWAPALTAQTRSDGSRDAPEAPEAKDAREAKQEDVLWRIRREATDRSEIMKTIQTLTDLYGPRLTGSPNLRRAQDWILQQATAWGLKNAHLEDWNFGHPGWLNERASVHLVAPVKDTLVVEVLAWTPGTAGTVTAETVVIEPPIRPTQADFDAFFEKWRGKLAGRAVLVG